MSISRKAAVTLLAATVVMTGVRAADVKVDLSKETVGKPPTTFEPMVGTWIVQQDGPDKVIGVDGRPWVASKDNPTKLLIESARRLYGTTNEELMDNAKQFAYYPVAVLKERQIAFRTAPLPSGSRPSRGTRIAHRASCST